MSSEAAYFPDSLASTPEALGLGHCAPAILPELNGQVQLPMAVSERNAGAVIRIPEISDALPCSSPRPWLGLFGAAISQLPAMQPISSRTGKQDRHEPSLVYHSTRS